MGALILLFRQVKLPVGCDTNAKDARVECLFVVVHPF